MYESLYLCDFKAQFYSFTMGDDIFAKHSVLFYTGGVSSTASPGIRRKILPSHVLPKATSPIPHEGKRLTQPQPFTPSQPLRPHTPVSSSSGSTSTSSSPSLRSTEDTSLLVTSSTPVSSTSSLDKPHSPRTLSESRISHTVDSENPVNKLSQDRQPRYV